jgi:translation initiation factor 3 subunit E
LLIAHITSEFSRKREQAVSTHERLELEAQAVLDVIENPDVAQALRQDKNQNLQYLKDNYNVRLQHLHHLFRQHLPIS